MFTVIINNLVVSDESENDLAQHCADDARIATKNNRFVFDTTKADCDFLANEEVQKILCQNCATGVVCLAREIAGKDVSLQTYIFDNYAVRVVTGCVIWVDECGEAVDLSLFRPQSFREVHYKQPQLDFSGVIHVEPTDNVVKLFPRKAG